MIANGHRRGRNRGTSISRHCVGSRGQASRPEREHCLRGDGDRSRSAGRSPRRLSARTDPRCGPERQVTDRARAGSGAPAAGSPRCVARDFSSPPPSHSWRRRLRIRASALDRRHARLSDDASRTKRAAWLDQPAARACGARGRRHLRRRLAILPEHGVCDGQPRPTRVLSHDQGGR